MTSRFLSPPVIETSVLPEFLPQATISDETKITLYTVTPECDIYFTADGSEPDPFMTTALSTRQTHKYSGPFYLSPGFISIRAVTVSRDGRWRSAVSSRSFDVQSRYHRVYVDIDRATSRLGSSYYRDTYTSPRLGARVPYIMGEDYPLHRAYRDDARFYKHSDLLDRKLDHLTDKMSSLNPFSDVKNRIRYPRTYWHDDIDVQSSYAYDHGFGHNYDNSLSSPRLSSPRRVNRRMLTYDDDHVGARWDPDAIYQDYGSPRSPRPPTGKRHSSPHRARRYKTIEYFDPKSY